LDDTGTALGGTAFTNSHVVGLSYDFQVRAYLSAPGIPNCLFFYHAGSVGTNVTKTGVDTHQESGSNPLISMYWNQIVSSAATFSVAKDYKWGGLVGTIEGLVIDLLDIGAGAVGAAIGAVIGLTQEAVGLLHTSLGPGGTLGVIAGLAVVALHLNRGLLIAG
jgi:hypothetical protein